MIAFQLIALLFLALILIKATNVVVDGLSRLSEETRVAKFGLAAFLLALSTSLPELFVGITAAMRGAPELSLGNVLGSNIANISLIMGLSAVLAGSVVVMGEYLKQDFMYAFLAGGLPLVLLFDRSLSRLDGMFLLAVYGIYVGSIFGKKHVQAVSADRVGLTGRWLRRLKILGRKSVQRQLLMVGLGIATMLVVANLMVQVGVKVAVNLGVPVLLVGLLAVAIGTSLPELVLGAEAIAKKQVAVVFGNLLGSTVANSTLIIGLTAVLAPIRVEAVNTYLVATIAYVELFWLFWYLTKTKRRLERWEGLVLVFGYMVFAIVEFLKSNGWFEKLIGL